MGTSAVVYLGDAPIETTPCSVVHDQEHEVDGTFGGRNGGKDILALTGRHRQWLIAYANGADVV